MNPLLNPFETPFQTAPFSKIKIDHYEDAFAKAIQNTREEIDGIVSQSEAPTFANTLEKLDASGEQLDRISSILFNLNSAETSDDIQAITRNISPKLSALGNDITMNVELFKRVAAVYEQRHELDLTPEQSMLLDKQYKRFTRNGANLNEEDQQKLRKLDKELAELSLAFGENVLKATNDFQLHVTVETTLDGLPDSTLQAAKELAEKQDKTGYIFTLQYPSYIPFMTYASDRSLREKMYRAFSSRAYKDEHDNTENVLKIVRLRHERAKLLGFDSHAAYVLAERMALSPDKVKTFSDELLEKAKPAAKREHQELSQFAAKLDGEEILPLQKWDAAYYAEKLKQKKFQLDEEQLKPYFELEKVLNGAFTIAERLYGLTFERSDEIDKYHPDVRTYLVKDDSGEVISIFYADFHPREGKRDGAWMTVYKRQYLEGGKNHRPHISIVCNFSEPTSTTPSLLRFNEVTTLFHEFGHALHGILADTQYRSLSGTSVLWDFVELPSQIMENWCYEPEALELFAQHYKTGETIPKEYIDRIKKAANFHEGLQTLRQLSFGMLDMSWHDTDPSGITDVKKYEQETFRNTDLYPDVASSCMSTAFSHIFQGGYSAGYYSYKWAEVLDADAFEVFKEKGIFDRETADSFRENILSKGGTISPMDLYKRFRGSEPKIDALLKRAGLMEV